MSRKRLRPNLRGEIQHAWDSRCAACDKKFETLRLHDLPDKLTFGHYDEPMYHLDHLEALQFGGRDELWNLWPLCVTCHARKTARENKLGVSICPKCNEVVRFNRRDNLHPCILNYRLGSHTELDKDPTEIDFDSFRFPSSS